MAGRCRGQGKGKKGGGRWLLLSYLYRFTKNILANTFTHSHDNSGRYALSLSLLPVKLQAHSKQPDIINIHGKESKHYITVNKQP